MQHHACRIGHDGTLIDQHTLGCRGRSRRILHIGHFISSKALQPHHGLGIGIQFRMGQDLLHLRIRCARRDMLFQILRCYDRRHIRRAEHACHLGDVGILAADIHAVRHGRWNEASILATKKSGHEIRPGFRHYCHALAALQASTQQFARCRNRAVAQFRIGQHMGQLPLATIEVEPGLALGRIIKCLRNRRKSTQTLRQFSITFRCGHQAGLLGCRRRRRHSGTDS